MEIIRRIFGSPVSEVSATEAQAKLGRKGQPLLLDVRQPEEFRNEHIQGAKLIPLGELARRMGELPKDREIIVVCRSGNRSLTGTRQLTAAGYQAVNLSGGMIAWARSGLPIKRSGA